MIGNMIENQNVMQDIEEIFKIDGLDFCLFGPADYSMSLGYRKPIKNDEAVLDAIKRTCEAANKNNKIASIGIGKPWRKEAEKYAGLGTK